jgi:hypothetical protein
MHHCLFKYDIFDPFNLDGDVCGNVNFARVVSVGNKCCVVGVKIG